MNHIKKTTTGNIPADQKENEQDQTGFKPFPVDALPEPICGFIKAGANAIGSDTSFIALPLLSALAAAIGTTRRLRLKHAWTAPAIIWSVIVGESGTSKSPAFQLAMRPIRERQFKALKALEKAREKYEEELAYYEKSLTEWKRDKKDQEPPPAEPREPKAERCLVQDTTVEALAPLLLENPRGLLLACDELAGWFGSFGKYSNGKASSTADTAHWLSMYGGETITVDRKTGMPKTIFVPQASISITGGIQPATLHRVLGSEHRESGLAARFLLAWPPRKAKIWTEADIDPSIESELADLFERLFALEPDFDERGEPKPKLIRLDQHAKNAFIGFVNQHGREQTQLTGDLAAAWSKLEEIPARLSLIIHLVRHAANDPEASDPHKLDMDSMQSAIEIAEWFKAESRRIYPLLAEIEDDRERRQLIEWIERKGGSITARELQQGNRRYKTGADAALCELADAGMGRWEESQPGPKGGRPTKIFHLVKQNNVPLSTKPTETRGKTGFGNVDNVDTPKTGEEWGFIE